MITQVSKKSLKLSPVKTLLLPLPHQPVCVRMGGRGQVRTEEKARNTTEPQRETETSPCGFVWRDVHGVLLKMTLPGVTRHL